MSAPGFFVAPAPRTSPEKRIEVQKECAILHIGKGLTVTLTTLVSAGKYFGTGVIAVLLTEWLHRRRGRLQRVQLIERVNRLVEPTEGFVLARRGDLGADGDRHWIPVEGVREYEFTLRNTTSAHLKDLEIQFEFSAPEIDAKTTRTLISKTALVTVEPTVNDPWRSGKRWRIPYFPPKDSVEFSFKGIGCPSEGFEAALLNTDRVVIERVAGEPAVNRTKTVLTFENILLAASAALLISFSFWMYRESRAQAKLQAQTDAAIMRAQQAQQKDEHGRLGAEVKGAGCSFLIDSSYDAQLEDAQGAPKGPWLIELYITNTGGHTCVYKFPGAGAKMLEPRGTDRYSRYSDTEPIPVEKQLGIGIQRPDTTVNTKLFAGGSRQ